jgi:hypothetical protein
MKTRRPDGWEALDEKSRGSDVVWDSFRKWIEMADL